MPDDFRERILADRAAALATRDAAVTDDRLAPRIVCVVAGGRHVALPVEMVVSIRPFQCSELPLLRPGAIGKVLGLSVIGRQLASIIDLGALLGHAPEHGPEHGPGHAAGHGAVRGEPSAGSMLLLRGIEPVVALRVDQVLGVARLLAARQPGLALLQADTGSDAPPPLVSLLEPATIAAAIAALDAPP